MTEINPKQFVSSIKIKGLHFFPPVISDKKRIELQKYKQQAIKLEKRLEQYKILEKSFQGLLNIRPLSQQSHTSLSEISFNDTNSHLKALGISPKLTKSVNLSTDIIDITEYGSNGIKILGSNQRTINSGQDINHHKHGTTNLLTPTSNKDFSGRFPLSPGKPRLIRSNSYTLDNPSPILLAHLEKHNECKFHKENQTDEIVDSTLIKSWSSSDDNLTSLENSEFSSMNTVCQKENLECSGKSLIDQNEINLTRTSSPHIEDEKIIDATQTSLPLIELIHADISIQHLTVHNNVAEEKEIVKSTFELSDPDNQLLEILRNIPEDYSKRIIDLIEKEHMEQIKEMEAVKRESDNNGESKSNLNTEELRNVENKPRNLVESSNVMTSSPGFISPSAWSQNSQLSPVINFDYNTKSPNNEYYDSALNPSSPVEKYVLSDCNNKLVYNREQNITTLHYIKREWAANVICAYVKGYLTRRLLKTTRVQSLIATIRDALMCALQLHSAENIDETDVELHRRLINQVTAACYAFHDVFFSLSISEQMYMISTDRQHKLEKAKRPVSAPQPQRPSNIKKKQRTTSLSKSVTKI